jgi:hypothetical protein
VGVILFWCLGAPRTEAEEATLVFQLLEEKLDGGRPQVVNGKPPQDPADWRSILVANLDPDGQRRCTASLVGQRAILTAAHCLDFGTSYALAPKLMVEGTKLSMTCVVHPDYLAVTDYIPGNPRSRADYALCRLGALPGSIKGLQDVEYEVLDLAAPVVGEPLILTGYGCTRMKGLPNGEVEAILDLKSFNIGEDAVDQLNPGSKTYIESLSPDGQQPALCKGDSGGPALSPATKDRDRRVRGVASMVWSVPGDGEGYTFVSRISPTGGNDFASFADTWLAANTDAWICGVSPGHNGGTAGCRD